MSLRWSSATDQLYAVSNSSPSLDLDFASNKSLLDNISGLPLVNHQRDASSSKSAGTYVGSDGLIKTSVVNLQPYSEITVNWTAQGSTLSPDFALAPNGTNAAAQIIPSSGIVEGRIFYPSSLTGQLTASCFFKPNGYNFATIGLFKGSNYASIIVNLLTGEVTAVSSGAVPEAYSVTDAGNGWKRLSVTTTTVNSYVSLAPAPNASTTLNTFGLVDAATFDGTSGVLAWGAQLEEGSTVNTYVTTTNLPSAAPRFDHDPVTGESLGLLIEESRTNLLTYSEEFNATYWAKFNSATGVTPVVTANYGTAPDGTLTADRIVGSIAPTGGADYTLVRKSIGGTSGNNTFSVWLKSNTGGNQNITIKYTLSAGLVTVTPEWQRFSVTATQPNFECDIGLRNEAGINTDNTMDVLAWGAQLEEGSFRTSYIPTSGTTVTRAADVASITGTNFSSLYNQSEGTMFAEATGEGARIVGINDGTSSNRHEIFLSPGNVSCYQVRAGINEVNIPKPKESKSSFAYKTNDYSFTSGGSSVVTDTSATPPTVDQMNIGCWFDDTAQLNGHISRLTYYPYRLSDTILQEITS